MMVSQGSLRFSTRMGMGFLRLVGVGVTVLAGCSSQPPQAQPVQTPPVQTNVAQNAQSPTPPPPVTPAPPSTPQPTATVTQPPSPPATATQPPPTPQPSATQPPAPSPASIGVTGPGCTIKGIYPVTKDTQLFDAPVGGRAIANFTGNFAPMTISDIPADPLNSRSKLVTSTGSGSLRLEGFVQTSVLPVFSTKDIVVVAGHVWITSAQKLKLTGAATGLVTAEMVIAGTNNQKAKVTTACDAFSLQRGTPTAMEIPGNGRGYLTKGASVDIYDRANGDVVFSLQLIEGTTQLFWSTETKPGFVHVQSRTDLAIDGWIRATELTALKKGEMMDQYIPPQTQVSGAQLAVDKPPRVAAATKPLLIRAKRDEKDRPIGVVEVGAEIYIMYTIAGWTHVLPKSLYVLAPEDGGFWIPAREVP